MRTCEDVARLNISEGNPLVAVQPAELLREHPQVPQGPLPRGAAFRGQQSVAQGSAHVLQGACTQGLVLIMESLEDGTCIASQRYDGSHVCYIQGTPSGPARPPR